MGKVTDLISDMAIDKTSKSISYFALKSWMNENHLWNFIYFHSWNLILSKIVQIPELNILKNDFLIQIGQLDVSLPCLNPPQKPGSGWFRIEAWVHEMWSLSN